MRAGAAMAALSTFALTLALTTHATADATRDADRLFDEGKQLMDRGIVAGACAKFEASLQIQAGIGVRLWLADCYETMGRTATAQRQFRIAADEARRAGDKRELVATRRAEQLEPRTVKIILSVRNPTPDERIDVDGVPVDPAARGSSVSVDPGRHLVAATANGRDPWELSFDAHSAERPLNVVVPELVASSPVAPSVPSPTPLPRREAGPLITQRTTAIIVAGVGAAGLAAGGVLALLAVGDKNDSARGCGATCTPEAHAEGERALHEANAATVAFLAGGALIGVGGVLYLTAKTPRVTVTASSRGIAVHGAF